MSPGLNGLVGAAATMLGILALFLAPLAQWVSYPVSDIGDAGVRSENLGVLGLWITALCTVAPFAALGGYLGGRTGSLLRTRYTASSAR